PEPEDALHPGEEALRALPSHGPGLAEPVAEDVERIDEVRATVADELARDDVGLDGAVGADRMEARHAVGLADGEEELRRGALEIERDLPRVVERDRGPDEPGRARHRADRARRAAQVEQHGERVDRLLEDDV